MLSNSVQLTPVDVEVIFACLLVGVWKQAKPMQQHHVPASSTVPLCPLALD